MRATGLQGDVSPEIIEILDDNTNVFGDRAPNTVLDDTGGPRWVGPVAAAALIALIGYGVATSASSSSLPKAAAAPSTLPRITTSTTVPAPTTTQPALPPVPYYAADPPREFTIDYAEIHLTDSGFKGSANGPYQLWATDGAAAAAGTWFSINTVPGGAVYAVNAVRVQTDQQSIAISHTPSGQSITQYSTSSGTDIILTSFGWSDDDLVRLAAAVTYKSGSIAITDPSLTAGYQMITTVFPFLAVQGDPLEQVSYESNIDVTGGIQINVAPRLRSDQGGSTLDRQIALRFFLDDATPFDVDGHVGVAGTVVAQGGVAVATWIADTHIVTVSGDMSVPDLIAIARTVHQVTEPEWQGMQFQAAKHNADHNFGNFDQTPSTAVAFGTDGAAKPWTITVSVVTFAEQQQLIWGWAGNNRVGSSPGDVAKINTVVDDQRTYVLADLPKAIAATANLQVILAGRDPVLVPFTDALPALDRSFAAFAFSEPSQYTAQIISDDGAVLANWPQS